MYLLNNLLVHDKSYVQTTYGEVMPKEHAGIKVNLECCRCKKIFSKPACQIRPEQKFFYCSRDCMKDPDDVRRAKKNANRKKWNKENPQRNKAQRKAWRDKNREKIKAYKRNAWAKDLQLSRAKSKLYNEANREKINKRQNARYHANKEQIHKKFREWYKNNREKALLRQREYCQKNRKSTMMTKCKMSAKNKGIDFNLTHNWFHERLNKGTCELSGIPFDMVGKRTPNSPSVDRIDPKGGYTIDNCRLILWSINRALCNYGQDYLFDVFKKIFEQQSAGVG